MAIAPANSTYQYIETKVRRLTASSSEQSLRSALIQEYVNNFYNQNFPNSIKTDQMRSVYTFYTAPNIDRYPVNVNYNQAFRSPVYVDGIQGSFFKDRDQFFLMWPRWPTLFQQSPTTLTGTITAATNANPAQITSANHGLITGSVITITGVLGMVQLNGNVYTITVVDLNNFTLDGIDSTAFGVVPRIVAASARATRSPSPIRGGPTPPPSCSPSRPLDGASRSQCTSITAYGRGKS